MGSGGRLRVEVLGPVRVLDGERDATPSGALQRRLLAMLVLRRDHVVSIDWLIDGLWPDASPQDPVAALQNHLSRLRRDLPGLVESVGSGYRLDGSQIDLDADSLTRALAADVSEAALPGRLRILLARWHGPAFAELADTDDGRAEAVRLGELRVQAQERLAEIRIDRGDTDGLVAELSALVESEPLRERPRSLLMSALQRAGRAAEALRVFDDFRRVLGAELGIEPSPALEAQHLEILAGTAVDDSTFVARRVPAPTTGLVGRDELFARIGDLVESSRCVSLVGPGGVGKTRLLVELGHRLRDARPDRPVAYCELAQANPATAVDVAAAALGIDNRPGVSPVERIVEVVGDASVVVLLDNCEHVLTPVAELVDRLLEGCPRASVVTTSRERLRVRGEVVCAVPTLPTGTANAAAVELFLQRARAVQPGLAPDPDERACIDEIVARLDGLPLAIELAAARLHTHDLAEVAAGLDDRFSLLSEGPRTATRHRSLGAAVSWSVGLLDPELQDAFASLSVFCSPFRVADAAAVCSLGDDDAARMLAQLVERSLVLRAPDRHFVLLETLRAYGAEQLHAAGRADDIGERHAGHMLRWAATVDTRMHVAGDRVLAEVDDAIPGLRAALAWLVDHDRVEQAGRLVVSLLGYGVYRLRPDVLAWADLVLACEPDETSPTTPRLWASAAYVAWMSGDLAASERCAQRALEIAERSGPVPPEVATVLGNSLLFDGALEESAAWHRRAVVAAGDDPVQRLRAAATELLPLAYAGDPRAVTIADALLDEVGDLETATAAYVWYAAGEAVLLSDTEVARTRLVTAIDLAERTHASFARGIAGASKASIDARVGDPEVAAADYRWLIPHWRRAGMWATQWTMMRSIAVLLERLGDHRVAAMLEGAVTATAHGHRIFGADAVALAELGERLRTALGESTFEAARHAGAELDDDAAVELALTALRAE